MKPNVNPPVYVKPNEGATIHQPNRGNRIMPKDGDYVPADDVYYIRLINSGDLVLSDAPKQEQTEARRAEAAPREDRPAAPAQDAPHASKHK